VGGGCGGSKIRLHCSLPPHIITTIIIIIFYCYSAQAADGGAIIILGIVVVVSKGGPWQWQANIVINFYRVQPTPVKNSRFVLSFTHPQPPFERSRISFVVLQRDKTYATDKRGKCYSLYLRCGAITTYQLLCYTARWTVIVSGAFTRTRGLWGITCAISIYPLGVSPTIILLLLLYQMIRYLTRKTHYIVIPKTTK